MDRAGPKIVKMVLAGLFFGFLVGVGLVAGFKYVMDKRSKNRIQKVPSLENSLSAGGFMLSSLLSGSGTMRREYSCYPGQTSSFNLGCLLPHYNLPLIILQ